MRHNRGELIERGDWLRSKKLTMPSIEKLLRECFGKDCFLRISHNPDDSIMIHVKSTKVILENVDRLRKDPQFRVDRFDTEYNSPQHIITHINFKHFRK